MLKTSPRAVAAGRWLRDEEELLANMLRGSFRKLLMLEDSTQNGTPPEQVGLNGDVPGALSGRIYAGHDARPRPSSKQRPAKKSKSDATASTGGSSASAQFEELMEQELRLKWEAAERAFEAQAEKDRTLMRLKELRFLATSTKDLDEDDAHWIKKQKKLIKNKMKNDLGDEDDEDEDE
ncbi:hypothetical protein Tco_1200151 [Tanacetum coccineum]